MGNFQFTSILVRSSITMCLLLVESLLVHYSSLHKISVYNIAIKILCNSSISLWYVQIKSMVMSKYLNKIV